MKSYLGNSMSEELKCLAIPAIQNVVKFSGSEENSFATTHNGHVW